MTSKLYLSKTLFSKVNAFTGCQRKLYYEMNGYPKVAEVNETLKFYADNGNALGALAKGYYPQGIEIAQPNPEKAYEETIDLIKRNSSIVLFEAAFIWNGCYIRVDVLIKEGNTIKLIEVKSKQIKFTKEEKPNSDSKPLVVDLTFQYYVVSQALGNGTTIEPYFYQLNKNYQEDLTYRGLFQVKNDRITLKQPLSKTYLDKPILVLMNADTLVKERLDQTFKDHVQATVKAMKDNQPLDPQGLGKKCRDCEFKVVLEASKNGFKACWQLPQYAGFKEEEFKEPSIFDIGFGTQIDKLTRRADYRLQDAQSYLSNLTIPNEKQLLQVKKLINHDASIHIDRQGIQQKLSKLTYPLYFLDFEAFPSALPLFPYYRPNQKVIFQYSIHKIEKIGNEEVISHHAQFIDLGSEDPTLKMIRSLQKDLGNKGSVFMYSSYENTCLNSVEDWLIGHPDIEDQEGLVKFIHSLTYRRLDNKFVRKHGKRAMIDLCDWVINYYLDPATKGSNSIKKVLPSVIQQSVYLQQKYGQKDLYGKNLRIKSLNFHNQTWLVKQAQQYLNPYELLSNPLGLSAQEIDNLEADQEAIEVRDGGMAMIAYSKIQNDKFSIESKDGYKEALLKYCELDTLAMVMVFEALFKI